MSDTQHLIVPVGLGDRYRFKAVIRNIWNVIVFRKV